MLKYVQCLDVDDLHANAVVLWEDTAKHYKTSYLAWTSYTDVLMYVHVLANYSSESNLQLCG